MGGEDICHSGGLVGKDRAKHITSFGEDEYGKHITTTVHKNHFNFPQENYIFWLQTMLPLINAEELFTRSLNLKGV